MSTSYVLIVFALVILLMIFLISKCKVNAAMGILIAALILAIALGTPWAEIEGTINSGFSGTIKSVAIVIFLGCTMGTVLEKTGAAVRITKWAIKLVGEKNMIWAIALSSFILGIPIFADTVVILLIPIGSADQEVHDELRRGPLSGRPGNRFPGTSHTRSCICCRPVKRTSGPGHPVGAHCRNPKRHRRHHLLHDVKDTSASKGGILKGGRGD